MKTKELILNLLSEESSLSPKEIASKVNKSDGSVRVILNRLLKENKIRKVSFGCYESVNKRELKSVNKSVNESVNNLGSVNIEELGIETKRKYYKGYQRENRERVNEYHRKYFEKNRERINEYQRKYRKEHRDKFKEYEKSYWEKRALKELKDEL